MTKVPVRDLRLVVDYLRAVRNEVAVDRHIVSMAGLNPDAFGKIPRPARWIGKMRRFPLLSRLLQHISLPLWYVLGPALYARHLRQIKGSLSSTKSPHFDVAGQILGLSQRSTDIVHERHVPNMPRQWLELPWMPLSGLPSEAEVIPAIALLDEEDIARSLVLASLAHRALQSRHELRGWGLQSYTAWRWFFARLAIDKLPGPLLTTEHFDRWAVMADASVWASRLRRPGRFLTVMQHGAVNAGTSLRALGIELPTKLRAVTHLHVYTPEDAEVFTREILSVTCRQRGVQITFFRPFITLTEVVDAQIPSVLFVGHPLCADTHMMLASALITARVGIRVLYKPHPTTGAGKAADYVAWTLVQGRTTFPRVDAVVSYPSTMVGEYAAHDIPTIVHSMALPPDQAVQLMPEILRHIDARRDNPG